MNMNSGKNPVTVLAFAILRKRRMRIKNIRTMRVTRRKQKRTELVPDGAKITLTINTLTKIVYWINTMAISTHKYKPCICK